MTDWLVLICAVLGFAGIAVYYVLLWWRRRCLTCGSHKLRCECFELNHVMWSDNLCRHDDRNYLQCAKCDSYFEEHENRLTPLSEAEWQAATAWKTTEQQSYKEQK